MSNTPRVTVLMPVFNGEKYLSQAIDSILQQSYTDFEFVIINDGSTDQTQQILETYKDPRIRLFHQNNLGLAKSLNMGIRLSRGEYIVRMDCDDISNKNRLSIQVDHMDANPNTVVCGSWIDFIDESNTHQTWCCPTEYHNIRCHLLFSNCIPHPSVIMKKNILIDNNLFYNEHLNFAQDYELWVRISRRFVVENIPEILLKYRTHENMISVLRKSSQLQIAEKVIKDQLGNLGIDATVEEITFHIKIGKNDIEPTISNLRKVESWLVLLLKKNYYFKEYREKHLRYFISQKFWKISNHVAGYGMDIWKLTTKSIIYFENSLLPRQKIAFFLKCLFKFGDREAENIESKNKYLAYCKLKIGT
jgi:glycosyltransferase involved in cell wall biosynthesis